MYHMEEKLLAIVTRIESAPIGDSDKDHLYVQVRHALQAAVAPVLVSHVPKDKLHELTHDLSSVTLDRYIQLIAGVVNAEGVMEEIEASMISVLGEIDTALLESGV